jgi:hypothetical protein
MTTLTNSFHGTSYRTQLSREQLEHLASRVNQGTAVAGDKDLYRKIRKALCGCEGCKCGQSDFNERN